MHSNNVRVDEAEQIAAAQISTAGGRAVVSRSMARRASEARNGSREGESAVSTSEAEVEAVGDSLNYIYLFT